jgi:hypothetical protein
MLRRVTLVRTDVPEERSAAIIRVTRIGELGTTLAVTGNRSTLKKILCEKGSIRLGYKSAGGGRCSNLADSCNSDVEGDTFLGRIGCYKSHKA